MKITRITNSQFEVASGNNIYRVNHYRSMGQMRWTCTCPARRECKHLRTVRACGELGIGATVEINPIPRTVEINPIPRVEIADSDCDHRNIDYEDQHMADDVAPLIVAARRGRAAYRRFLGY